MISTYRLLITAGPSVTKYNSRKVLYLVPRKQILRDQKPITRSPQLPHIPVTAFSQTNLFLVWIYLKFRSPQESLWPTDHIRILGIGLEQACNGGSCGWISFTFEKTPRETHLQASSSPILGYEYGLLQSQAQTNVGMPTWCRHVRVRRYCFILTEACSCRLELACFARKNI